MDAIDGRLFRDVLGHYPTGVALVTGIGSNGEPIGMIVGSFTSVSLEPPLVAFLPTVNSYTFSQLREAPVLAINVLSAEQEQVCRRFASRIEDKWAGVEWSLTPGGAPVIEGAVAWIECTVDSITEAGDHYLVMCRVRDLEVVNPVAPLLFFQGGYGKFVLSSLVATSSPGLAQAIKFADVAREEIEDLANRLGVNVGVTAQVGEDLAWVAMASSPEAETNGPTLGNLIPLMAPLGEQYVAWLGEEAEDRWIARSGINDEETRAALKHRLACARERGWSLSRMNPDEEPEFFQVIQEYSEGELTPARERALRSQLVQWSKYYDLIDIKLDDEYSVTNVVMPVLGSDGRPIVVIRIAGLPRPSTGAAIIAAVDELRHTVDALRPRLEAAAAAKDAGH